MNKPQPQTGPEIEEYSTTATPKAYAGSVPVFCAHDAIVPLKDLRVRADDRERRLELVGDIGIEL